MTTKKLLSTLLLSAASISTALAAGTAQINTDGEASTVIWQDVNNIVLEPESSQEGRMVVKDGKMYSVQTEGGKPLVIELGNMMQALGGLLQDTGNEFPMPSVIQVTDTNKTEQVAGIQGRVYSMEIEEKGKRKTIEAVFTDNKTAVEMTEVYISFVELMMGQELAKELVNFHKTFPQNHKGLLRFADDFIVTSLNNKTPDPQLFELPATPMNMQNLMQQLMK